MGIRIGLQDARPRDPACDWTRLITCRPADHATVALNPPRFSWPYLPEVFPASADDAEDYDPASDGFALAPALFTFEIATSPGFEGDALLFCAERTPFNFFNAIAPLPEGQSLYWRVAYLTQDGALRRRSAVRTFSIQPGAAVWDRSGFLKQEPQPRPRLYRGANPASMRQRIEASADCRDIYDRHRHCEFATTKSWWHKLPAHDRFTREEFARLHPDAGGDNFTEIAQALAKLAFQRWLHGGDLAEVAGMAAQIAAYPIGGLSSPEGAPGSKGADVAQLPEFLAVVYDLCHDAATPQDLAALREGIAWRLRFTYENFAVYRKDGARVGYSSMLVSASSHPFEASGGMIGAAALMQDDPDLTPGQRELYARVYAFGLHWIAGVTNGFGTEDGWNEGPGYGNSKMQWLVNAVCYADLARPSLQLGRNPALKAIGEFFLRTCPLGLRAAPFGNGAAKYDYVVRNRMAAAFCLAYLLRDGTFRRTWVQSEAALKVAGFDASAAEKKYWRPWLCFGLAARDAAPKEADAPAGVRHFQHAGWVTAATESPNRLDRFANSAGLVVQARPVGGYQHAFFSDGSPQLWAFGEILNYGSGSTANSDPFAYSPMSTNTVLVNGIGQRHLCHWKREHFLHARVPKQIACFAAYRELPEHGVYALADLTHGYSDYAGPAGHWWGDLEGPYQHGPLPKVAQALRHILFLRGRYFVILDDYRLAEGEPPAAFTWLWHVLQDGPAEQLAAGHVRYQAGAVRVDLVHLHQPDELTCEDRKGLDGALNPLSGEDYRENVRKCLTYRNGEGILMAHNFWFTAKRRATARRFLAVVYPTRAEEAPPMIESLGELTFRVRGPHGQDTLDFTGKRTDADVCVDAAALADAAGREREVHPNPKILNTDVRR